MSSQETIQKTISDNEVVLYMKGSAAFPQCGFSGRAVQILNACGKEFTGVDVLSDPDIREGVKQFSNWPTIPQLYIKGEFVGGCDIMMEMYQSGELKTLLTDES